MIADTNARFNDQVNYVGAASAPCEGADVLILASGAIGAIVGSAAAEARSAVGAAFSGGEHEDETEWSSAPRVRGR